MLRGIAAKGECESLPSLRQYHFQAGSYGPGSYISEKRIRAAPIWSNNSCHII